MNRISVIGAGFAALTAVRTLRKSNPDAKITMIAPKAEFVYAPSLIWIPARLRKGEDLRIDLHNFLARQRVTFHAGRVIGLKDGGRTVVTIPVVIYWRVPDQPQQLIREWDHHTAAVASSSCLTLFKR